MKRTSVILLAILGLFTQKAYCADREVSLGVGVGALYSGVGVNVGLRGSNDFAYLALGCIGLGYSDNSGWLLPCGIGAGWIWTGLFSKTDNHHGLGIYAGPVGVDGGDNGDDDTAIYGLGITYVYFLRGIDSTGWSFGITPTIGKDDGDTKGGLLLNAGYQF
jgi:hypothetical protein